MQILEKTCRGICHCLILSLSTHSLYGEVTEAENRLIEVREQTAQTSHPEIAWIDSLPLEERIRINLRQNYSTAPYADRIMITDYDGMILLQGTVRFYSERNQIQAVVQQTNGVYRVENKIMTAPMRKRRSPPSQSFTRPSSD